MMVDTLEQTIETARREGWTSLSLLQQGITRLPESIGGLTKLEHLDLPGNCLTELPDSICNLTELKSLNLNSNRLVKLPDNFGNLTQLEGLYLPHNRLTELPESIANLTRLRVIQLDNNRLNKLPDGFGMLRNLRELYLPHNELTTIPDWIGDLVSLRHLWLHYNLITKLPDSLGELSHLLTLFLDNNQISELPDNLCNLTDMYTLLLGNNLLTEVPDWISNLAVNHALHLALSLGGNPLADIPGKLGKTLMLDLKDSPLLTTLPETLEVDSLDISGCKMLSSLPDGIIVHKRLELANTALTELPRSLENTPIFWNDLRVTPKIAFHPDALTIKDIREEKDDGIRWLMIERLSNPAVHMEILDTGAENKFIYRLLRLTGTGGKPYVGLSVEIPDIMVPYVSSVPADTTTCRQAIERMP